MDSADAGHDVGGVEVPDSAEFGQGGSGRFDGGCDIDGGFGDTSVECADLGDEVSGQAAQRLRRGPAGPDLAQDIRRAVRRQTTRSSRPCPVEAP
jgi:hypothetical protein